MHISIDIETLSTRVDATIIEIGITPFDPHTGEIGTPHSTRVWREKQNRHIDADTLDWWSEQEIAPPDRRHDPYSFVVHLNAALHLLRANLHGLATHPVMWAKGPAFDLAILRHAYDQYGWTAPWHHRDERCIRTAIDQSEMLGITLPEFTGERHSAKDDSEHQAKIVCALYQHLHQKESVQCPA